MPELKRITNPSDNNAATQNTKMVAAYFISADHQWPFVPMRQNPLAQRPKPHGFPVGPGNGGVIPAVLVEVAVVVAGVLLAGGNFSLSPALMRSVFSPLRDLISVTVVPCAAAILLRVSPDLTT